MCPFRQTHRQYRGVFNGVSFSHPMDNPVVGPTVNVGITTARVNGNLINSPYPLRYDYSSAYNFHGSMTNYQYQGQPGGGSLQPGDVINFYWTVQGIYGDGWTDAICQVPCTEFKKIYNTYQFDEHLRHLLLSILEPIEISIRTKIAYFLGHEFGTIGYREASNFVDVERHSKLLKIIDKELDRSNEMFISHYKTKYNNQFPIWVAAEVMSIGTISKFYSNMKRPSRNAISKTYFNLDEKFLKSWMQTLVQLRNTCAHYARIYGKSLSSTPLILQEDQKFCTERDKLFAALLLCKRLYSPRDKWTSFVSSLSAVVDKFSEDIKLSEIGFPEKWEHTLREVPTPLKGVPPKK